MKVVLLSPLRAGQGGSEDIANTSSKRDHCSDVCGEITESPALGSNDPEMKFDFPLHI